MNERIRELERKCWESRKHPASQAAMGDKFNPEKFAQLILQECITIAENEEDRYLEIDELDLAYCMQNYQMMIKQYFGVLK